VLCLGGCLPTPVVLGGYAADGASYVATDKTLSDHGISGATMRDCSVLRIFRGRAICRGSPAENGIPVVDRRVTPEAPLAPPSPVGRYVVVGSFIERGNAERTAQRFAAFRPAIVKSAVDGRAMNRVVLGPLAEGEIAALRESGDPAFWSTQ
jgi:ribosomal protein S28E/S33